MNTYYPAELESNEISDIFVSMTTLLFNQLPIPINFIDNEGKIIIMNTAFLDFIDMTIDDVIGKPLAEVDASVRLPIVIKTGNAEIGQKHTFQNGKEAIVHRIPLFYKEKTIGGVGIILVQDLIHFYNFFEEKNYLREFSLGQSKKELDIYRSKYCFDDIITHSQLGKKVKKMAESYANTDFTVLITGESGVGKELFAHSIHNSSRRKDKPFVRINLASIPESLLESELFGYEKGAFTGAKNEGKIGKFELANGGTIFLDEISEVPHYLQVKLLRVLQEKELERIGGNKIINLDIRVIAATNKNLEDQIKDDKFRQDLFYRLNVLNLYVPNLKERKLDISLLIQHFSTNLYQDTGIRKRFPDNVMNLLTQYTWPGNIRELKNIVERISVISQEDVVSIEDIPDYIKECIGQSSSDIMSNLEYNSNNLDLKQMLANIEKQVITDTLEKNQYNKALTAKDLNIPRMTLYRKIKEYSIQESD